jgi:hypothetical protein
LVCNPLDILTEHIRGGFVSNTDFHPPFSPLEEQKTC